MSPLRIHLVTTVSAPPYRIPPLAEILATPRHGAVAVSTFSGCGGSSLGLTWAGWTVLAAVEFVEAARDTYRSNFPGTPIVSTDIRDLNGDELRDVAAARAVKLGVPFSEIDLLEGSPPCSPFSMAGNRAKTWGHRKAYSETVQTSDDLFFEFARLVAEIRPRAFVAENVPAIATGVARGYFKEIIAALAAPGYRVSARVLDSQWLGVPQARRRMIIVGMRTDQDVDPSTTYPRPLPYRYSIRDALPWVSAVTTRRGIESADGPPPTIQTHGNAYTRSEISPLVDPDVAPDVTVDADEKGPSLGAFAIGREWDRLRPGESSDRYFNLVRPHPGEPAPTITQTAGIAGAAGITHPHERRKFSIPELRRLSGFPDDFRLTGTYRQRWERIGRAVPPPVYRAVGETLAKALT